MKTICTTVYTFAELSDSAKRTAISNCFDINTDTDWWDGVYEDFYQVCDILGIDLKTRINGKIDEKCVWFSGFSSQGDGACFEGCYTYKAGSCKAIRDYAPLDKKLHSIADNLKAVQKSNFYRLRADISQIGNYFSISVDTERTDYKAMSEHAGEDVKEAMRDLANWLYKTLEADHDYLTSDAAIIETIEANEYHFTEQGKMKNF